MAQHYTYLHCRPDGTIFYVGKGQGSRAHTIFRRNAHHKSVVKKYGAKNIQVFVFPCASEREALSNEVQQIAQLRQNGTVLCNATNGGEGTSGFRMTLGSKALLSSVVSKQWEDPLYREKIRLGHEQHWTKEKREKQAIRARQQPHSLESAKKLSTTMRGLYAQPEYAKRQADRLNQIRANPDLEARRVAAMREALLQPEYRAAKSQEMKNLWQKRREGLAPMPVRKRKSGC